MLVLKLVLSNGDCGCSTSRDGECSAGEKPSDKYSKESNEIKDNKEKLTVTSGKVFDKEGMVLIEKATFEMGTDKPVFESDFEGPLRNKSVDAFYLDVYEVSNKQFADFVDKTGYKTEAEEFGDSFIFEMLLPEDERKKYQDVRAVQAPWWIKMQGVTWKQPEGPNSNIEGI